MRSIKVASVIVTWNKLRKVCLLIEDIHQLVLNHIQLDIYIVDNGSTDGTQRYLEEHYPSQIQVLQTQENLGGSGGFSYGLQRVGQLEYDYLWLLDNDVRLDPSALIELVNTLQIDEEVGLVGSQIRKAQDPQTIQELGSFINSAKAHLKPNFGNCHSSEIEKTLKNRLKDQRYVSVDVCAAASLLVRREVVQQIGVFEDYFLHFDDVEWCLRAKQFGWTVAANPASIVWHDSPDSKCRAWISYYDERNLCYCWQKHRPELVLRRAIVSFPRLVYYAATGRYFLAKLAIQGYQDFLKNRQGKMPDGFNEELALAEIILASAKLWVQSTVYHNESQHLDFQQIQQKILFCDLPKSTVGRLGLWLIACFWKPIEIAIVHYHRPSLFALNLARQVYCFTGSGYIPLQVKPMSLVSAIANTISQLWQIYWQMRQQTTSTALKAINPQPCPFVSVVVCTTDRPLSLEKALQALEKIRYPDFEVIVVDASLTPETSQLVTRFSKQSQLKLKFQTVTARNISHSRNAGIKLASGSIVAFFDDDAIPPPEWIEQLVYTYALHGETCAAVGGSVRDATCPNASLQFHRGITSLLSETIAIHAKNDQNHTKNCNQPNGFWFNGVMGTNASFRKELLEKINGYDEFFDYFLDETDVCLRLIQAGYEVHYTDVVVDHYPQPSHNRIDQKHLTCWYSLAKNTTYFAIKHGFQKLPWLVLISRLAFLLAYRCLFRILRLKFTHQLPLSTLLQYLQQAIEGVRVGWSAGMKLHATKLSSRLRAAID